MHNELGLAMGAGLAMAITYFIPKKGRMIYHHHDLSDASIEKLKSILLQPQSDNDAKKFSVVIHPSIVSDPAPVEAPEVAPAPAPVPDSPKKKIKVVPIECNIVTDHFNRVSVLGTIIACLLSLVL